MPRDYVDLHREGGVKIGMCEIQGHRPSQEDSLQVAVAQVQEFRELSYEAREQVLIDTFDQLQNKYGKHASVGSTGCVVTAWVDEDAVLQVACAGVGDSAVYLVVVHDDANVVVRALQLNELHNPDPRLNANEYARVAKISVPSTQYEQGQLRLNGLLAVSRAFGDTSFERYGLLHTPEILQDIRQMAPHERAFIVLACDGLTENDSLDLDRIASSVNRLYKSTPVDRIANFLVNTAFVNGSYDNISAAVFEVGKTPQSAAIFDGHNGAQVSQALGKHFYPLFEKTIKAELKLISRPKHIEEIQRRTAKYVAEVRQEILEEITRSPSLRKIIAVKYELPGAISRATLIKHIQKDKSFLFDDLIEKYQQKKVWKQMGSSKLMSLVMQMDYAKKVVKTIKNPDSLKAMDDARALFKNPEVRHQLEKGHGFWGWLLHKLGWTKGQSLVKFINSKDKVFEEISVLENVKKYNPKK
jgi:serine/threonine protein phosphatase PrpC